MRVRLFHEVEIGCTRDSWGKTRERSFLLAALRVKLAGQPVADELSIQSERL